MTGLTRHLTRFAMALAGVAAVTLTTPAADAANVQCGPRDAVIEHITGKVKADRRAMALAGHNNMVEFFVSKDGNWIMTITRPDKATCVTASGSSWESMPIITAGPAV